jgi:CRP-like cAMP-binding protein
MSNLLAEFKQAAITNILRRCPLFKGHPGIDLNTITTVTVIKTLEKGDFLFCEGNPVHGFYIVQRGAIKVYRVNQAGREQVIRVFRPYESFAEETLLSDSGHLAYARAAEDSRVLMLQKGGFIGLLKRQPELGLCLLRAMSQHLRGLVSLVDDLTLKDVKTRLANWLVQRCPNPESEHPCAIELPMTKNMLASELGTGSETLSRTFAILRDQKLLSVKGKIITLLRPSKLAQLCGYSLARQAASTITPLWARATAGPNPHGDDFLLEEELRRVPARPRHCARAVSSL